MLTAIEGVIGARRREAGSNATLFAQGPSRPEGVLVGAVPSDRGPGFRDFVPLQADTQVGVQQLERERAAMGSALTPQHVAALVLRQLGGGVADPAGAVDEAIGAAEQNVHHPAPPQQSAAQLLEQAAAQQPQGASPLGATPSVQGAARVPQAGVPSPELDGGPAAIDGVGQVVRFAPPATPRQGAGVVPGPFPAGHLTERDTSGSGVLLQLRQARQQAAVPTGSLIEREIARRLGGE